MEISNILSAEPAQRSRRPQPKTIAFELLLDEGSKTRARIPLRILVNPHDTTESIINTVRNFYGIYTGYGVSFEDLNRHNLTACYENLVHNSVVYVRTFVDPSHEIVAPGSNQHQTNLPYEPQRQSSLGEPFQMAPPNIHEQSRSPTRSASRLARKRSISPAYGRGRRSASQQKPETCSASRGSSANGSYRDDAANGYSDSDAGRSSITGSKKARSEQFASADISMDNVLQDGRRMNGSFFDSSVLPLYAPPQVPITTSTSSISPQRRSLLQEGPSPFHPPAQKPLPRQTQPLLSPQSHGFSGKALDFPSQNSSSQSVPKLPPHGHRLRDRGSAQPIGQSGNGRAGYNGHGVLPTPDPTVASCISDEDVARQLIALGDMSNFSHGRTSNSTLDDTFSGAADASSTGATSDSDEYSEDDSRLPKHRKLNYDGDQEYQYDSVIKSELDDYEGEPRTKKIKTKVHDGPSKDSRRSSSGMKGHKGSKIRSNTLPKVSKSSNHGGLMKAPTAPATPSQPHKTSSASTLNFQHQLGADEEDLSSKPRCQRCRKSKKGCDRQRPCQRCKDAGIGIEGCVSEDEGNGRKGRYGRHMGVVVKKTAESVYSDDDSQLAGAILTGMASAEGTPENSKKRKR